VIPQYSGADYMGNRRGERPGSAGRRLIPEKGKPRAAPVFGTRMPARTARLQEEPWRNVPRDARLSHGDRLD